jgi:hypothetical protein
VAIVPAVPASPNGLVMGRGVSAVRPGVSAPATVTRTAPVTAAPATTRQRRERSRPSGSSRNGSVIPSVMAGAQENSPATAASWAASGSGRRLRMSWSTHGSKGISSDQTSPEAAYSQPIGLPDRRRARTSPTVA